MTSQWLQSDYQPDTRTYLCMQGGHKTLLHGGASVWRVY